MRARRALALTVVAGVMAACGAPQLADPPDVTAPPTTEVEAPAQPECTQEQLDAGDVTRSYAPEGELPTPGDMPDGSTMLEIQDRGRLVVGVSAGTLQFGFRNPQTGQLEGFDISILEEINRAIFGDDPPPIEFRVQTFAERLPALEAEEVDLVAHTMTINCNRWLRIGFSSTYYDAGQKVLVPNGSPITSVDDLVAAGSRVCVTAGGTSLDELSKPEYAGVELVERPETTDCLVAMQQGEADATTSDDTLLVGLAAQDPNLQVVGESFTDEPYGIGVNAENVDLTQFVNGVLEELRQNGRWAELYQEWLELPPPEPPVPVYGRES